MIETMISSSVLITAICVIRWMVKGKINPRIQYALWGLVPIRLMAGLFYPIQQLIARLESRFSVMNAADLFHDRVIVGTSMEPLVDNLATGHVYTFDQSENMVLKAAGIDWQLWIMVIWGIGAITLAGWMLYVNLKFHESLMRDRQLYKGTLPAFVTKRVYVVQGLKSPCYFSLRGEDAIYLPSHVTKDEDVLRHSLAHEMGHVIQGDGCWGILRCILLCMFWVNPLIWVAANLSKRDAELACDEVAVGLLGETERIPYGKTLVRVVSGEFEANHLFSITTTMAEGHKAMKERVEMLVKHRKRNIILLSCFVFAAALLVACTFTSGVGDKKKSSLKESLDMADILQENSDDEQKEAGDADKYMEETAAEAADVSVAVTGQWGGYYQLQMKGFDWIDDKHAVRLFMYEDSDAAKLIDDGVAFRAVLYGEDLDGTVGISFWSKGGKSSESSGGRPVDNRFVRWFRGNGGERCIL